MMKKLLLLFAVLLATTMQAQNLFNAATTTMSNWCQPGWQGTAKTNVATWNNGTVVVTVPGNCNERWQCQVKLHTIGIVLDASKLYNFTCTMNANNQIANVTVKIFDNSALSERSAHVLKAGDNTVSNGKFSGGSIGNGVIVFDFGFAKTGDVITISNIVLEETEPDPVPEPGADGYSLVWNEDFTDGAFDNENWNIEVNGNGGGNNELQYYRRENVTVERDPIEGKHCLVLTAKKENYSGKKCTSGRVTTQGKTTFLYGKIEGRIWFPKTANGLWPAFWMMGDDISSVSWPACGETDIVELGHSNGYNGTQERYFNGASHWGPSWDKHYQHANSITNPFSVEDGFHIWTCIWDEEHIAMYVDKDSRPGAQPYYEIAIPKSQNMADNNAAKYFHKRNFVLLNLAIGGNFPGIFDINQITALANGEKKMYIDWIRVYQKADAVNLISGSGSDDIEEADPNWEPIYEGFEQNVEVQKPEKQLHNGSLIIVRGDARYDVLGHRLY